MFSCVAWYLLLTRDLSRDYNAGVTAPALSLQRYCVNCALQPSTAEFTLARYLCIVIAFTERCLSVSFALLPRKFCSAIRLATIAALFWNDPGTVPKRLRNGYNNNYHTGPNAVPKHPRTSPGMVSELPERFQNGPGRIPKCARHPWPGGMRGCVSINICSRQFKSGLLKSKL